MSDSLHLEYVNWGEFDHRLETAKTEKLIANVMRDADTFLHSIFVAGDEPKWSHECQRADLLNLRKSLLVLAKRVGVLPEKAT